MKSITQDTRNDYWISSALKSANAYKSKGFSVIDVFQYLFCMVFTNRSLHINWIRFTTILASRIISESVEDLTDESTSNQRNHLLLQYSMIRTYSDTIKSLIISYTFSIWEI